MRHSLQVYPFRTVTKGRFAPKDDLCCFVKRSLNSESILDCPFKNNSRVDDPTKGKALNIYEFIIESSCTRV